jgi:membrane protein DedA with SNARE-associated domain
VFPPIPSELVLPLAGFLAGQGRLSLPLVIGAATLGSVVGALLLYAAGATLGRARLERIADRLRLVDGHDLDRAEQWFGRHGGKAVLIGRLVPVVRSLISVPADVERMPLARFTLYTAAGSGAYNTALVCAGYLLGNRWRTVGRYSDYINDTIIAAGAVSIAVFVVRRSRRG